MNIELGILLGKEGGAQSFENVGSWSNNLSTSSFHIGQGFTNSSDNNIFLSIESGDSGNLSYDYNQINDARALWEQGSTTHVLKSRFWAMVDNAAFSGDVLFVIGSSSIPIAAANSLQYYQLDTTINSGDAIQAEFQIPTTTTSQSLFVDDLLTVIDNISFAPGRETREGRTLIDDRSVTMDGQQEIYKWSDSEKYTIQIENMPEADAKKLNLWGTLGKPLLLNFNNSDSTSLKVVRMAETTPLPSWTRPYQDERSGVISLELQTRSLVF